MFAIGDKILHPMHGAGVIQDIEEKDILGEIRKYYVLKLPFGNMNVLVPVEKCMEIGIRPVISREEIDRVFVVLREDSAPMSSNWNKRQRQNMDMMKSGDILKVAEVVRNLIRVDREKVLSNAEKKLLDNAKQILESELILAGGFAPEEADRLVEDAV